MKAGDVAFWGPEPIGVKHDDPAVRRVVEEIITEHMDEYQEMLSRVMSAWMLGTGGEALGRSLIQALDRPWGGTYTNAKAMYDGIAVRLFGADVVWPKIAQITNKHRDVFSTHIWGPGMVFHPRDWDEVYYPLWKRHWQPWLYRYEPLVVDREKLARQITWLLDPNKAMSEWFESEVGRKTGLFYPGYWEARVLQDMYARDQQAFLDLLGP